MFLSSFYIFIELAINAESVSSNCDCEIFLFFGKLTGSGSTFVSGRAVLDSHDLLHVSAGNQLPACGILIADGLLHHSVYK